MLGQIVEVRSFVSRLGLAAFLLFAVCLLLPGTLSAQKSADLDESGYVDASDLMIFQEQWHMSTEPSIDPDDVAVAAIQAVTIAGDNKPEIEFSLTDGEGDVSPLNTVRRLRFLLARIVEDNLGAKRSHYVNYTLSGSGLPTYTDITGATVTDLGSGNYIAKYKKAINISTADRGLTHTLGIQIEYDLDNDGQRSVINPLHNFRPDGGAVTTVRELSSTETCNKCHNPLAIHGGGRREYGICILCHYPGVVASNGFSVDMAHMVHQIHIVKRFVNADNAGTAGDGINSATPYWNEEFGEITYPQDIRNCRTCHTGSTAHPEMAEYHLEVPSREACGGCHDKIDFANGIGHLAQANDNSCTFCHPPLVDLAPTMPSVANVHIVPSKSPLLPKIFAEILSVDNVVAGATPSITYKLYQDVNGVTATLAPSQLNRVGVDMAGPTTDYAFDLSATLTDANSPANPDGSRTYEFAAPLAANAAGTYAFSLEARTATQPILGESVRATADNPVVFVAVGGKADPVPRRQVIDWDKCLACHDTLVLHGGNRNQYMNCVLCHRPGRDDESQRTEATNPPESIDFKYMIHKIHAGVDLDKDYTVYGFGGNPINFNEVTFPGDRRDCESCHLPGTYGTPAPAGALPTVVTQEKPPVTEPVINFQPTTAACVGCHDSDEAIAHAQSFTAINSNVENCAECHGRYAEWSFEKAHFRGL